jgi:hypothetical protein
MRSRVSWPILVLCGATLAGAVPAAAKMIPMQPVSRSAVDAACSRAGGTPFAGEGDAGSYGCTSHSGSVNCSADGDCSGFVSDLLRMPSNSLDAVLGAGVNGQPVRIGPADRRVGRLP